MKTTFSRTAAITFLSGTAIGLLMAFQNCSRQGTETGNPSSHGTETGNPSVQIEFSGYNQTALIDYLIPKAHAAVSDVRLCVHQLRFFADRSNPGPGVEMNRTPQIIELLPSGTVVGNAEIPPGVYRRIDVMLKNNCSEGGSIQIQNDAGAFSSKNPQILRFTGEFQVPKVGGRIVLEAQAFINFLDSVTSDAGLADGLDDVEGDF